MLLHIFFYNYARTKVDLSDSSLLEETLTLHNVIILFKSVFLKKIKITTAIICFSTIIAIFFFYNIILLIFGEKKIVEKEPYDPK